MRELSRTAPSSSAVPIGEAHKRPRSLLPHEHGAYGQLALPLLTALAVTRPTPIALGFTSAFVAGFLAHEPALVVAGLAAAHLLPPGAPLAVTPLCAVAAGICAFPPPMKQMRVVGWSLVAASVLTAVILIVLLRSTGGS